MTTVRDIVQAVDRLAPFALAEAWDHVGLQVGDPATPVARVLVALDVSEAVLDEAAEVGADLVLAHHPLIFKPLEAVTADGRAGRLVLRLAREGRAMVAAHTNLDAADGGLCDLLARRVGLVDLVPLQAAPADKAYKVVVFVPETALAAVREAAFAAGAGRLGAYSECGFVTTGTGTFRPEPGASPAVGQVGRREAVAEARFETLVERRALGRVLAAVAEAHPYERPAVDVHPLRAAAAGVGLGRLGRLETPVPLAALADTVREALGLPTLRVGGNPGRTVQRVALVTGAGSGLTETVAAAGADAYVTGELKLHEVQDLAAEGIGSILGGHYETERVPLEAWAPRLAETTGAEVVMATRERGAIRWE